MYVCAYGAALRVRRKKEKERRGEKYKGVCVVARASANICHLFIGSEARK